MEEASLHFQCLTAPLFRRGQVPTQAEDQPPAGGAQHQIARGDKVGQTRWVYFTGSDAHHLVEFVDLQVPVVEDDALEVADAEQVIAERQEENGTLGEAEATGLRPERYQGDEGGEETSHGQDEDPCLGNLLLVGRIKGICAALRYTLVEEESEIDGTCGD